MVFECNIEKMIAGLNGIVGSTAGQTTTNNTPVCQSSYLDGGKVVGNTFSIGDECPETSNNLGYANYQTAKNFNDNYGQCTTVLNKSGFPVQIAKIKLEPPTIKRAVWAEADINGTLEFIWEHSSITLKVALVGTAIWLGAVVVTGGVFAVVASGAAIIIGLACVELADMLLDSPIDKWWDGL